MRPVQQLDPPARRSRDLYVVSDLHLGRGLDPATKRYHRLEAFFYDDDFRAFCRWACEDAAGRGAPMALVLDGDVFDLLRVEPEVPPGATPLERRFGPPLTPDAAARLVGAVLAGHPAFVEALADVLDAGHDVILLHGNHDLEVQWPQVQDEVRRAVAATLRARRGGAASAALARLRFEGWFHHEPGRVWIEHGCQYDPENAFRYPLRRQLPEDLAGVVAERDMPLGNFFQRYLYNAFGPITFIVPTSRANYRYFRFLLANQPRLLLRVARSHGRFLVQVLRRLGRRADDRWRAAAEAAHGAELRALAERSGLGERLAAVDALKCRGADAARAASGMLRQAMRLLVGGAAGTVLALLLLTAASQAIQALGVGFGWKALLSLLLYLAFGGLTAAALVTAALRMPPADPPPALRGAAERIARLVEVPLVVLGHAHEEGVTPIEGAGGPAWYFNTGTWLAVFTHDVLMPRERVQYTFLRIRDREGELLQWSPGRHGAIPVVLLDPERDEAPAAVRPVGRPRRTA